MSAARDSPEPGDRDRSVGLMLFGVLEILLGLGIGIIVPLLMFLVAGAVESEGASSHGAAFGMLVMHAVLGAAFGLLGVGSIRARRWAREVWLSVAWIWLLTGALSLLVSVVMLPSLLHAAGADSLPRAAALLVGVVTISALAVIYVVLPVALLLFYRSPHVEATCRTRGPERQWTDGVPRRIVTLVVLWLAVAISAAVMPAYNWVTPFFGAVFSGAAGAVVWIGCAIGCVVLAAGTAKRRRWSWNAALVLTAAAAISTLVTFARVDLGSFIDAMGLPADQAALMVGLRSIARWQVVGFWILVWAPFAVYLWRLRADYSDA